LAGRDSHPLDARQNFMKALHPPIPIDPHCLVALCFLSVRAKDVWYAGVPYGM